MFGYVLIGTIAVVVYPGLLCVRSAIVALALAVQLFRIGADGPCAGLSGLKSTKPKLGWKHES
jgi:hypothetical protein